MVGTNDICGPAESLTAFSQQAMLYYLHQIVEVLLSYNKHVNLLKPPPKHDPELRARITSFWDQVEREFLPLDRVNPHSVPWPNPEICLKENNVHLNEAGSKFFSNFYCNLRVVRNTQFCRVFEPDENSDLEFVVIDTSTLVKKVDENVVTPEPDKKPETASEIEKKLPIPISGQKRSLIPNRGTKKPTKFPHRSNFPITPNSGYIYNDKIFCLDPIDP